jgi:O-succinylbenzoic acid--CoA ligase
MAELVAIDLPQDDSLAAALADIWERGDAACVLDPRLGEAGRQLHVRTLRPTMLLDDTGLTRLGDGEPLADGDALCVMTSGSTADPKAAILTHDAVQASALASSGALRVDPGRHRWLCCLPCAHIGGLSVITRALLTGTPLHVIDRPSPEALEQASALGATHVSLVATALARIDPALFELILLGGAAPPGGLPGNVVTTYGMTETGSGVVYDGKPLAGVELAIAEPDADGLGEILVRGPMLLRSYRDRPAPLVGAPDGTAGWLATDDLGRLGADGTLEVRGRRTEVIVTGAEKVFPHDVEQIIAAIDGVVEVAVWKRADDQWGERVVAYVVADETPPELAEIRAAVTERLSSFAAPKELVLLAELPRTASGKIRRSDLDVS